MAGETRPPEPGSERPGDSRGFDAYLTDLETIRNLMTRYEEQPMIRPWAFGVWATLVVAGSVANWFAWRAAQFSASQSLLGIWLPVLVVAGLAEMVGYLHQTRINGAALVTRRSTRLLGAYLGLVVVIGILIVNSVPAGFSAGAVLAIGAAPLLVYAQMTFASLFLEAFVLLGAAVVLEAIGTRDPAVLLACGVATGIVYAITGLRTRRLDTITRNANASEQSGNG